MSLAVTLLKLLHEFKIKQAFRQHERKGNEPVEQRRLYDRINQHEQRIIIAHIYNRSAKAIIEHNYKNEYQCHSQSSQCLLVYNKKPVFHVYVLICWIGADSPRHRAAVCLFS